MKVELNIPPELVSTIVDDVVARLKPLLVRKLDAPDDILTTDQLAEYLGIGKQRVYEAVSLKTIPYFKVGKNLRFKKSAIDKWIEAQSVPASFPCSRRLKVAKSGEAR